MNTLRSCARGGDILSRLTRALLSFYFRPFSSKKEKTRVLFPPFRNNATPQIAAIGTVQSPWATLLVRTALRAASSPTLRRYRIATAELDAHLGVSEFIL